MSDIDRDQDKEIGKIRSELQEVQNTLWGRDHNNGVRGRVTALESEIKKYGLELAKIGQFLEGCVDEAGLLTAIGELQRKMDERLRATWFQTATGVLTLISVVAFIVFQVA